MHKIERVVAAALAGLVGSAATAQDAVQWRVEDGGNGHWYALVRETRLRTDAAAACASRGGHLIDLFSDDEANFARKLGKDTAWIGIAQNLKHPDYQEPDGGWFWDSRTVPTYTEWRAESNEPNNLFGIEHTACMAYDSIEWNDVTANSQDIPAFFIEWSTDCNRDGIVDYGQVLDGTFADEDGDGVPDICEAEQWRVEDGGNGHWYMGVRRDEPVTWEASRQEARLRGGHLVTLTSSGENRWVLDHIMPPIDPGMVESGPYLGASRIRDGEPWRWVTGERWAYTDWCDGEPTPMENYLNFYNWEVTCWNNAFDDTPDCHTFVMEWSDDCNADGIVDYGQILDGSFADQDANGVPDCCEPAYCVGDLNGDDAIGPPDLGILLALWNTDGSPNGADLNDDGTVNAADLGLLIGAWGDCGCN